MIYWTRQTIVAFAAGGLFVGGMIPIIQNLATLDLPGLSAAFLSDGASAPRGVAKANGTIPAVAVPSEAQDRVQRARAGEPVAGTDAVTPIPLASHSRGRDL